jgi:hypothetical protein
VPYGIEDQPLMINENRDTIQLNETNNMCFWTPLQSDTRLSFMDSLQTLAIDRYYNLNLFNFENFDCRVSADSLIICVDPAYCGGGVRGNALLLIEVSEDWNHFSFECVVPLPCLDELFNCMYRVYTSTRDVCDAAMILVNDMKPETFFSFVWLTCTHSALTVHANRTMNQFAAAQVGDIQELSNALSPNTLDKVDEGWTVLHYAARFGRFACARWCIEMGANVDFPAHSLQYMGYTALHVGKDTRMSFAHYSTQGLRLTQQITVDTRHSTKQFTTITPMLCGF